MRSHVTIVAWEGMAIYVVGLVIGFGAGYAVRWASHG